MLFFVLLNLFTKLLKIQMNFYLYCSFCQDRIMVLRFPAKEVPLEVWVRIPVLASKFLLFWFLLCYFLARVWTYTSLENASQSPKIREISYMRSGWEVVLWVVEWVKSGGVLKSGGVVKSGGLVKSGGVLKSGGVCKVLWSK